MGSPELLFFFSQPRRHFSSSRASDSQLMNVATRHIVGTTHVRVDHGDSSIARSLANRRCAKMRIYETGSVSDVWRERAVGLQIVLGPNRLDGVTFSRALQKLGNMSPHSASFPFGRDAMSGRVSSGCAFITVRTVERKRLGMWGSDWCRGRYAYFSWHLIVREFTPPHVGIYGPRSLFNEAPGTFA